MLCHYRDYDFKAQDGQRHIIIAIMCPWEWCAWDIVRPYCKLLHKCLWIEQDQTTFQKLAKIWSSPSPVRNLGWTLPGIWPWVPQECILGFSWPPTSKDIQSLAVAEFSEKFHTVYGVKGVWILHTDLFSKQQKPC